MEAAPPATVPTAPDRTEALSSLLRLEVGRFRAAESRRAFDPAVHVGLPAGERDSFTVRAADAVLLDHALRTDVVSALVGCTPDTAVYAWVTRPGTPHPHDVDLAWLSAAELAFGGHGRPLRAFFAVTRAGWLDVRTGRQRTWKRLRL